LSGGLRLSSAITNTDSRHGLLITDHYIRMSTRITDNAIWANIKTTTAFMRLKMRSLSRLLTVPFLT
ncbi:hypothetical protein T05_9334, partial [Trichinella murrelli]